MTDTQLKGHLKIFFGYAAGVGKTYAMLNAALTARERGVDVIAGYIDSHDRPQTAALTQQRTRVSTHQTLPGYFRASQCRD